MRSSHILDRIATTFDDGRLIADAGLLLPATLAQHLGLERLLDEHVDLGPAKGRAHVGAKALTLIMSALAGGDCIDDADALRAGGTAAVLGHALRAPSTLGTFLRSFSWAHARQLDVVSRELLRRAWATGAGSAQGALTIDLDSTICETYGLQKEGATHFTYTHVRGYHPLLAVAAGTGEVLHCRLRGGRATSGRGAAGFLAETIARVRGAGASGPLMVRADAGFYEAAVVRACRKAEARFSITVRLQQALRARIEALAETAWAPIPYWQEGGADVAELPYTPFAEHHPDAREVRLIVRRVRPSPGSQLALFTPYSYHAFITDRAGATLALEADHRRHAVVENTIRDLKYGVGLGHLPSGRFGANAAWLALQVMAHNLARWTGHIGLGDALLTTKTIRRRLFSPSGRLAWSARRLLLHLPRSWPWADRFAAALAALRAIALPLTA
ncbi:MAG TPA: IS1380 family transposase [Burkholderiales bacterium]|nr:IS1380 family transposase [Burkholderiales bacterium]